MAFAARSASPHRFSRSTFYNWLSGKAQPERHNLNGFVSLCLGYADAHPAVSSLGDGQRSISHWVKRYQEALAPAELVPGTAGVVGSAPNDEIAADRAAAVTAILDQGFTGRRWVIDEIDRLLRNRTSGYVWVEAPAGMGKSALAAYLVHSRGWIGHFSRMRRGRTVAVALRNLATQLVDRHGLGGEVAPAEQAWTPEAFDRILAGVGRQPGAPVVLVVDGADEAGTDATFDDEPQPWGLPAQLPDGVVLLGTYRTGHAPPSVDPTAVVRIRPDAEENQRDLVEHLHAVTRSGALSRSVAAAGLDAGAFVEELADRSGGVWIYLKYVLTEIENGDRDPRDLASLPVGLSAYYATAVRRWASNRQWHDVSLPVLGTLAAAGEPLPSARLAALAGVDEQDVLRCCHGWLRPFLSVAPPPTRRSGPGEATRREFAIYHDSFRELLTGTGDLAGGTAPGLSDALATATTTAHSRIAAHYLGRFGGLAAHLPVPAADPTAVAAMDDGYPLRHLARHLAAAGRAADLHQLLRTEGTGGAERTGNVWFAAHDHADTIDDYLTDVALARAEAEHRTDLALDRHRPAPSLAEEIRYHLVAASVASLTTTVPTPLLVALLDHGRWTPQRVLAHVRRLADPLDRARALTTVAPHLPAPQRRVALSAALTAAGAVSFAHTQARAFLDLIPHLPPVQRPVAVERALAAALLVSNKHDRAQLFAELAQHLDHDQLETVLELVTGPEIDLSGAVVLTQLAPYLSAAQLETALAAAQTIVDEYAQVRALTRLMGQLPPEGRAGILAATLDRATALTRPDYRARRLAELAPVVPPEQRPAVLATALAACHAVDDRYFQAGALLELLPHLEGDQRDEALATALSTVVELLHGEYPHTGVPLLKTLISDLSAAQMRTVQTSVQDIAGTPHRVEVLVALASRLPPPQASQAITTAQNVHWGHFDDQARGAALLSLAPHLTPGDLGSAVANATTIPDRDARITALAGLVPFLPPPERSPTLAHALALATEIADHQAQVTALAGLAPYLSAAERAATTAAAFDTAAAITDNRSRVSALRALMPYLTPEQLATTLRAVTSFAEPFERVWLLAALAPHLDHAQLTDALAAGTKIYDDHYRARAIEVLAPHLTPEQLDTALAATSSIGNEYTRVKAFAALAPHLSRAQLTTALTRVTDLEDPSARVEALAGMAPHLAPEERAAVLDTALAAAAVSEDDLLRLTTLEQLALHLLPRHVETARDIALAIVRRDIRPTALAELAPHTEPPHRAEILATALADAESAAGIGGRVKLLARIGPGLPPDQRVELCQSLLDEILGGNRVVYWNLDVCRLAPCLTSGQLDMVLHEVHTLANENGRAGLLAGLAPHLNTRQIADALEVAFHITGSHQRAKALTALVPHLSADQLVAAAGAAHAGDTGTRTALLAHAAELGLDREARVTVLRAVLRGTNRATCLALVPETASLLTDLAPDDHARALVKALHDVTRWWA